MAQKIQQGDIISLTVEDSPKKARIGFNALSGTPPLGFAELKLADDNETAFNAMVSAASVGVHLSTSIGHQVHVTYDDADNEVDEISIHS
jgi:hypothetical protein